MPPLVAPEEKVERTEENECLFIDMVSQSASVTSYNPSNLFVADRPVYLQRSPFLQRLPVVFFCYPN